jgi:hypothetical protein
VRILAQGTSARWILLWKIFSKKGFLESFMQSPVQIVTINVKILDHAANDTLFAGRRNFMDTIDLPVCRCLNKKLPPFCHTSKPFRRAYFAKMRRTFP